MLLSGFFLGSIGNVVVALNAIKERKNSTQFHEEVAERLLAMKGEIKAERKERRRRESLFMPAGTALINQKEFEKLRRQDSDCSNESDSIMSPEEFEKLRRKSRELRGSIIISPEQAAKLAYEHDHPQPIHNPHPNGEHDHVSLFGLNHFGPS